jgi:lysophospholipase L1-like esterase
MRLVLFVPALVAVLSSASLAAEPAFPVRAKRVLFMGDSITHAGNFVAMIEAQLRTNGVTPLPELINLGLPSETCSGLSEPDHPFPRPNCHERLERALEKLKPDVVVACYGMNDGIYYPFSEERFETYQKGVNLLIDKVHRSGAKLVLMTPPAFDPLPLKKSGKLLPAGATKYAWFSIYEGYDDVLKKYSEWIMTLGDRAEMLIDLHSPVTRYVRRKRQENADFTMSPDGVHVNEEGHAVLAAAILDAWHVSAEKQPSAEFLRRVTARQTLLHDAWLSDVGHVRPGVKPGLPIKEALAKAEELEAGLQ